MNKQTIFDKITCTHSLQNRVDVSQVYIAVQPAACPSKSHGACIGSLLEHILSELAEEGFNVPIVRIRFPWMVRY